MYVKSSSAEPPAATRNECNILTNGAQDPQSKMPELKACTVALEALAPGVAPRAPHRLDEEDGDGPC